MAITMQGPWTVSVQSKSAAWQQRFVIAGSSNGKDDAYEYTGGNPPPAVAVEGAQWTVSVEHRSASNEPWSQSAERIGTPSVSGSNLAVTISSNDSGSDEDYNDLVLGCTTAMSAVDHVIYGTVKSYSGSCHFNPCWKVGPYLVLENEYQLQRALNDGAMTKIVRELYPERARELEQAESVEFSDETAFRPMMIPMAATESRLAERVASKLVLGSTAGIAYGTVAKYKDYFKHNCTVEREAEQLLRFTEYDRTASELTGGPYTGDGDKQTLGLTVTDELGNYVFRFSRTLADIADEFGDIAVGGPPDAVQLLPDVVVQLLGSGGTVVYETALYSDVPLVKRIDLCFRSQGPQVSCNTGRVIERIGDVWVLPGVANTFDPYGRITVTDGRANFSIEKAAWTGTLNVWGCFSEAADNPVVCYTIRHRRWDLQNLVWGDWDYVNEAEHRTNKSGLALPWNDPVHKIGPTSTKELNVAGPDKFPPSYDNIETNTAWAASDRHLKLKMYSHSYAAADDPGTVQFRIEGFAADGNPVAGSQDNLILYIDNTLAEGWIESISLGGEPAGECGLFDLPTADAALTIKFKAEQKYGHLQSYSINVWRGSNTVVPVTSPQDISMSYTTSMGASFLGTANATGAMLGTLEADVTPTSGSWLPPTFPFCAFAFELWTVRRATDGRNRAGARREHIELIGLTQTVTSP